MLAMLKWLIITACILLASGFCVVNRHFVTLNFYPLPFELEMPVYLLMLLLFLAGFVLAWILARLETLRSTLRLRKAQHESDALRDEITRLRHQPLPKRS